MIRRDRDDPIDGCSFRGRSLLRLPSSSLPALLTCALILAAVLAALAGCGHDRPARPAPTSAFIAQADRICAETNRQMAAARRRIRELNRRGATPPQVGRVLSQAARAASDAHRRLARLSPPPQLQEQVTAWLDAVKRQIQAMRRLANHLGRGQVDQLPALERRITATRQRSVELAEPLDFRHCSQQD